MPKTSRSTTLFLFSTSLIASAVPSPGQTLYWTQPNGVFRQPTSTGETEALILQNHRPRASGIAVDSAAGKVYWTDAVRRLIERSDFDGSNLEVVVDSTDAFPSGIALDTQGGKVYWTNVASGMAGLSRIRRANLDGSNIEDVLLEEVSAPTDIALDIPNGKIYWTEETDYLVRRANLDGSDIETLAQTGGFIKSIALDLTNRRMYWAVVSSTGAIHRANMDGTDIQTLISSEYIYPVGITVDPVGGHIYWADEEQGLKGIYRADLDGNDAIRFAVAPNFPGRFAGVDVDVDNRRLYWGNEDHSTIFATELDSGETTNLFPNDIIRTDSLVVNRASNQLFWLDIEKLRLSPISGDPVTVRNDLGRHASLTLDTSTRSIYSIFTNGVRLQRTGIDNGEVDVLFDIPIPVHEFFRPGNTAIDRLRGYLFVSYANYATGYIRRSRLDGSGGEIIFVSNASPLMEDIAVDVVNKKLYWWMSEFNANTGANVDFLYRADLDGNNSEILESIGRSDVVSGSRERFIRISPWESAMYITNHNTQTIQRSDLDVIEFVDVAYGDATGVDFDACDQDALQSAGGPKLDFFCLQGPAVPLPAGCACSDLTGEGFVDLYDVSAFQLSVDR